MPLRHCRWPSSPAPPVPRRPLGEGAYIITLTDPAWLGGNTLVAARVGTAVVTVLSTYSTDNGRASALKLTGRLVAALKGKA